MIEDIRSGEGIKTFERSRFSTGAGEWLLLRNRKCDYAWKLIPGSSGNCIDLLESGVLIEGETYFPASFENLIILKNLVQEYDPETTIFPTAGANLGNKTLGIGARFTTLHWPGVDWAMANLGIGLTANQNKAVLTIG